MLASILVGAAAWGQHSVPLFMSADSVQQGFVRVINHDNLTGTVEIRTVDDAGNEASAVSLTVQPLEVVHFNSTDLEDGNAGKGLVGATGPGTGDWHLTLTSDLNIEALAYIRTPEGFLTSIHASALVAQDVHYIPTFNPGRNMDQQSVLRLVNPQAQSVAVTINGVDDKNVASGQVALTLPAKGAIEVPAWELEGGPTQHQAVGALGSGTGKWRLFVRAEQPIHAMSVLEDPNGYLTNLSVSRMDESELGAVLGPYGLVPTVGGNPDVSLFLDGALAEAATTESCTLSSGTQATCHRLTVAGFPVDHAVGPFCPPTTTSTAAEGGVWFDGNGLWDIDGNFITGLASLYGDSRWRLYDQAGNVNITDTKEAFEGAARPNVAPEYQNHCVEGRVEWLPNGEPVTTTVTIPTSPVMAAAPAFNKALLGVTLNGIRIDGSAPVNAILRAYTIAAFDDCGGHFNPIEGYHMHGAMGCSGIDVVGHGRHFGYALDGYAIYTMDAAATDLDQCGGHDVDARGYHYHAAPAAENSVLGCLAGEFAR